MSVPAAAALQREASEASEASYTFEYESDAELDDDAVLDDTGGVIEAPAASSAASSAADSAAGVNTAATTPAVAAAPVTSAPSDPRLTAYRPAASGRATIAATRTSEAGDVTYHVLDEQDMGTMMTRAVEGLAVLLALPFDEALSILSSSAFGWKRDRLEEAWFEGDGDGEVARSRARTSAAPDPPMTLPEDVVAEMAAAAPSTGVDASAAAAALRARIVRESSRVPVPVSLRVIQAAGGAASGSGSTAAGGAAGAASHASTAGDSCESAAAASSPVPHGTCGGSAAGECAANPAYAALQSTSFNCPVTFDTVPATDIDAPPCGHWASNIAWRDGILAHIGDAKETLALACLAGCGERLRPRMVARHAPEVWPTYMRYVVRSFADSARGYAFCPQPGCTSVVRNAAGGPVDVQCGAPTPHSFCFGCKHSGSHRPATCDEVKIWKSKTHGDAVSDTYLAANTKPCPSCGARVQRSSGCNKVICSACSTPFCYMCLRHPFTKYHDYPAQAWNCSTEPDWSSMPADARELKEMAWYLTQVSNHADTRTAMLGPKSKAAIDEAVAALVDVLAVTLLDTRFIHETADVVVRQREVLQWSYVHAYFMTARARQLLAAVNAERAKLGMPPLDEHDAGGKGGKRGAKAGAGDKPAAASKKDAGSGVGGGVSDGEDTDEDVIAAVLAIEAAEREVVGAAVGAQLAAAKGGAGIAPTRSPADGDATPAAWSVASSPSSTSSSTPSRSAHPALDALMSQLAHLRMRLAIYLDSQKRLEGYVEVLSTMLEPAQIVKPLQGAVETAAAATVTAAASSAGGGSGDAVPEPSLAKFREMRTTFLQYAAALQRFSRKLLEEVDGEVVA